MSNVGARNLIATLAGEQAIDAAFSDSLATVFGADPMVAASVVRSTLRAHAVTPPAWEMRTGGWRIDLPAAVAKSVATTAVATATMLALDVGSIPVTVLSVVAPMLFEIERIEVGAEDLWVHAHLTHSASGSGESLVELYRSLPDAVQEELSPREFAGVVERLLSARLATIDESGVRLESARSGRVWFALR